MDRISDLPDNVIELILDKLSIVDQVTTSVLSRNWRFKWTLAPSLELDEEFFECLSDSGARDFSNVIECVNVINSLLMQHSGRLRSFCLLISKSGLSIPESGHPINPALFDNPIQFVSRIPSLERLMIVDNGLILGPYPLPYSVFCSVGLKHLSLTQCRLCPPHSFGGFPNLESLCLTYCECTTNVLTWILSSCPQLQELNMAGLYFGDQTLHISAPKLKYFSLDGRLGNIFLEKAKDLEKVYVNLSDLPDGVAVGTSASTFFPDSCSRLCEISISNYVCKLVASCGGLQTLPLFGGLKKLTFSFVDLHNLDVFRCVLNFLVHSPNLKALTMIMDSKIDQVVDIAEYTSMVEYVVVGTNIGHLKEILFYRVEGTSIEMNMIELLLGISTGLEQMHIYFKSLNLPCPEKERQNLRKLLSFSRASVKAKIKIN